MKLFNFIKVKICEEQERLVYLNVEHIVSVITCSTGAVITTVADYNAQHYITSESVADVLRKIIDCQTGKGFEIED